MQEIDVIRATRRFLQQRGLLGAADRASVTFTGRAVAALLPPAPELALIHGQLNTGRRGVTLASLHPQAAAALRLLLGADPVARLLVEGLQPRHGPVGARHRGTPLNLC